VCMSHGNVINGTHASHIYGGLRAQSTRALRKNIFRKVQIADFDARRTMYHYSFDYIIYKLVHCASSSGSFIRDIFLQNKIEHNVLKACIQSRL
jgi:hypothetical protein